MRGIEAQFLALQKGFNELIPQHLLKPFDNKELEVIHFISDTQAVEGTALNNIRDIKSRAKKNHNTNNDILAKQL